MGVRWAFDEHSESPECVLLPWSPDLSTRRPRTALWNIRGTHVRTTAIVRVGTVGAVCRGRVMSAVDIFDIVDIMSAVDI